MLEEWIEINLTSKKPTCIVAVSNLGNLKRRDGRIEPLKLRTMVHSGTERILAYHMLAEHFIPKTEEDIAAGRNHIDHITHNPSGMNINDIRNLRWCTHTENCNFEEAVINKSKSHIGKVTWNKGVSMSDECKRKISEAITGKHWRVEHGCRVYY